MHIMHSCSPMTRAIAGPVGTAIALLIPVTLLMSVLHIACAQTHYDDHQNMMDQLGIKTLRHGPNPNDQSTFDEAKANPYKDYLPRRREPSRHEHEVN